MKHALFPFILALVLLSSGLACAQESTSKGPLSFDLDEEKLSIDADIPSVDLILSFREMQERNENQHMSFLDEIIDSAKHDPF